MKETTPNQGKPRLDAESFQQLLAAAHVLQEHNDRQKASQAEETETKKSSQPESAKSPPLTSSADASAVPDHSETLSEIVATQHQIQMSHLGLGEAMNLVAERAQKIADADGAVIGLLEENELIFRAASGSAAHLVGEKVRADACLSMGCLLHGVNVQCPDVSKDASLGPDFCREFGIRALIAVPIFSEGNVIGSLELHFAGANAFHEHDIRTCQLMAGLVTEARARAAEAEWKQALAAERATMLEALEKLKPQLQRLANEPEAERAAVEPSERTEAASSLSAAPGATLSVKETICSGCGNALEANQLFCGVCGTERNQPPAGNIQSKWASMWQLSQARLDKEQAAAVRPQHEVEMPELRRFTPGLENDSDFILPEKSVDAVGNQKLLPVEAAGSEILGDAHVAGSVAEEPLPWPGIESHMEAEAADAQGQVAEDAIGEEQPPEATVPGPQGPMSPWTTSEQDKELLKEVEELQSGGALLRFVKARRADIYLVAALIIVTGAIFWVVRENSEMVAGAGSSGSTTAAVTTPSRKRQLPPDQKLSLMDQLLVSLGVAEAPPPPAYNGNPDTKVWVDLHTALYYCPGSDMYGKTPKGKYTNQRDAQLDQFEPAYRKVCD